MPINYFFSVHCYVNKLFIPVMDLGVNTLCLLYSNYKNYCVKSFYALSHNTLQF